MGHSGPVNHVPQAAPASTVGHDGDVSSLQCCGSHASNMLIDVQVLMQYASDLASASLQTLHYPCAYGNLYQGNTTHGRSSHALACRSHPERGSLACGHERACAGAELPHCAPRGHLVCRLLLLCLPLPLHAPGPACPGLPRPAGQVRALVWCLGGCKSPLGAGRICGNSNICDLRVQVRGRQVAGGVLLGCC